MSTATRYTANLTGYGRTPIVHDGEDARSFPGAVPADALADLFAWRAVASPLYAMTEQGMIELPGHVANTRSDTGAALGVVSKRYTVHQYADSLVGAAAKITGQASGGQIIGVSGAGLLNMGAKAWLTVSLPDTIVTAEGVEFLPQLMCYGSHDGSLVTGYRRTVTNLICGNQMGSLTRRGSAAYSIRHTRNSAVRVADAQAALGIIMETADEFSREVAELCATTVTDRAWSAFLDAAVPLPTEGEAKTTRALTLAENKRADMTMLWNSDARCSPWRNTAWGVVQTVNTHAHHFATVRGVTRGERNILATLAGDWERTDADTLVTLRGVLATV